MTQLARFVTTSEWVEFAEGVQAGTMTTPHLVCPVVVVQDLLEKNGGDLSFWEIDTEDQDGLNRIVAAYCAMQKSISGVKLRWVDSDAVRELGIIARRTKARGCPDKALGDTAHWDLSARDVGKAVQLAVALASTDGVQRSSREVARCIIESRHLGRFGWDGLKPELVYQLLKDGHMTAGL